MTRPFLDIRDLSVRFRHEGRRVSALNGVGFSLAKGEVLGLLGESGSGKSVTLRTMLGLVPRSAEVSGVIRVGDVDVLGLNESQLQRYRGRVAAMIFQEPMLAFDPLYTVGEQIIETILAHEAVDRAAARSRALELFERVRIPSPERRLAAYPHEMSGGMRQRAMIAQALACRPQLLLADEPTTALDATVQIQVLLLLRELQRDLGLTVIFVTHDIGVAAQISDRIGVMYAGRLVELGDVAATVKSPCHPYTAGLLGASLHGLRRGQRLGAIPGGPPDLRDLPPGCAFAPRCARVEPRCREQVPRFEPVSNGQMAACFALSDHIQNEAAR